MLPASREAKGTGESLLPQEVVRLAYLTARRIVSDDEALDIAQDCWVKFQQQREKEGDVWETRRARCWLQRVATNAALGLLRKSRPEPLSSEPPVTDDPAQQLADAEEAERWGELTWSVLSGLSRDKRDLLVLRVLEEQDWQSIGTALCEKPATLRTRFTRLRREVRDKVEQLRSES